MPSSKRCCSLRPESSSTRCTTSTTSSAWAACARGFPIAFWTFLIAGCSLAGLPLITAGAFSKDWIIWGAWSGPNGSAGLWIVALAGVLLTTLYTFRMIFLVFFGEAQSEVTKRPGKAMLIPCFILAFLSIVGGYIKTPFARFLETVLPWTEGAHSSPDNRACFRGHRCPGISDGGVLGVHLLPAQASVRGRTGLECGRELRLHRFWFSDWGMDWLYDRLFVKPLVWFARIDKGDFIDGFYTGVARMNELAWRILSRTETGRLRWYAAGIAAGSVVFIAVVLFL